MTPISASEISRIKVPRRDDQAVALQAKKGFAHGTAADLEFLGEIFFDDALPRAQFAGVNRLAQMCLYALAGGDATLWFRRIVFHGSHGKWQLFTAQATRS